MAKSQQNTDVVESTDDMVTVTIPRTMLRYLPVEPSEFAALKAELGLSNKEIAEAIGRTLSRVSELTNSKGASRLVFEQFETAVRAYAAEHPRTEGK